jgi:hypothetical protein
LLSQILNNFFYYKKDNEGGELVPLEGEIILLIISIVATSFPVIVTFIGFSKEKWPRGEKSGGEWSGKVKKMENGIIK